MSILTWLEKWYNDNCYEGWNEDYGVEIKTLENPGWLVKIDIIFTELEDKELKTIEIEREKNDWLYCEKRDNQFYAACGPENLEEVLEIFKKWAEEKSE